MRFGARLSAALTSRGRLCVGIDPHPGLLDAWGLSRSADGLAAFGARCAEAFGATAAVIKPQSAFFEVYGAAGVAALEQTITACRGGGALVVLDVKRGDIGSTMTAYAEAYLAPDAPLAADAITVSPYLGVGALEPVFELAARTGRGAFVLARTSNPEGERVQRARGDDTRTVAQTVIDELAARNAGVEPLGDLGAVIGATIADADLDLSRLHGPILVPGVGTQGGTAADVRRIFGSALPAVLPSVSREVLRHGPDIAAMRAAVTALSEQFTYLSD